MRGADVFFSAVGRCIAASEGSEIPDSIDYELDWHPSVGYTTGDPTIERWLYWRATGQFPWPDSFHGAQCDEVEELLHLDRAVQDWVKLLGKPKQ